MSEYKDFSSLPPDKERHFVVFEQTSTEILKKARMIGIICGVAFGLLVVAIAFSHDPPHNKMAEDDMSTLKRSTKSDEQKEEAQPPAAPAAAPAGDTAAAPAPAGDTAAAPAAAGTAPAAGEAAAEAKPQ